jgi:predicted anti-sigma-YlaC factor YlaD
LSPTSSSCLDENTVAEWLDHRLHGAARQQAESHVDSCPACRRLLARIADLLLGAQARPPPAERLTAVAGKDVS